MSCLKIGPPLDIEPWVLSRCPNYADWATVQLICKKNKEQCYTFYDLVVAQVEKLT